MTAHNETPGLGDKIETRKSSWILQFAGLNSNQSDSIKSNLNQSTSNKSTLNQSTSNKPTLNQENESYWQVKKDGGQFDGFTGATITPRAVLGAISKNINYFNANKNELFSAPANCLQDEASSSEESIEG